MLNAKIQNFQLKNYFLKFFFKSFAVCEWPGLVTAVYPVNN